MIPGKKPKPSNLTLVFDRERKIDLVQNLAEGERLVTMISLAVTFNGRMPSGYLRSEDAVIRSSFSRWCLKHDIEFLDWSHDAAHIVIEQNRVEIAECLMRGEFDVKDLIPEKSWMAVHAKRGAGGESYIALPHYKAALT